MFDFSTNLPRIRLVNPNISKRTDVILGGIIRQAAREWLRAVLKSVPARGGFPVVTGGAISTLKPLGRLLRVAVNNTPRPDTHGRFRGDRRALGENSQQFEIDASGPEYAFSWSTDLLHYYINEFYGFVPNAPWDTMSAGRDAFIAYVDKALKTRIPNIEVEFY